MTKEEAIEALNEIFDDSEYSRNEAWYGTAMDMAIKALEQPERKTGKWIDTRDYCGEFLCSNCHETNINNFYKYCPECGAKMEGKYE